MLLYDGSCGFCAASVRFVLRHDRRGTLRFAALQSPFGRRALEQHPQLRAVDSVIWLDQSGRSSTAPVSQPSVRSDAALRLMEYLGGWWTVGRIIRIVRDHQGRGLRFDRPSSPSVDPGGLPRADRRRTSPLSRRVSWWPKHRGWRLTIHTEGETRAESPGSQEYVGGIRHPGIDRIGPLLNDELRT